MLAIESGIRGKWATLFILVSRIDGNEERLFAIKGDDLVSASNMDAGRSAMMGGDDAAVG